MIPSEIRSKVSAWLNDEASSVADEIIWRDDWLGHYKASRSIGGVKITITVNAETAKP